MKQIGNVSDYYDAYTNIRFKSYDQGVMWMEDNIPLLAKGFDYTEKEIEDIISALKFQVDEMAETVRSEYGERMEKVLTEKNFRFAIIGCSFSSEYLSYVNVVTDLLRRYYPQIEVIDAAVTAETVPQTMAHLYNRVLRYKPDLCSIYMGINDMRRNRDVYTKNNVSPREFARDMNYIIDMVKQYDSQVILHTLTPCNIPAQERGVRDKRWTYRIDDWDVFNGVIREIAEVKNCVLNDQTENLKAFEGDVNIPENGLHLTKEAQEFLAKHFMKVLLDTVETMFGER
ncbi:MAG: hypothetical protein HFE71_00920 [Emergencia sp.]|uniref:SGNH/GDSL hydrolase family protein n=1 Tax=Anaerotruncus colihominis TaxID=169435 RepID=A0A845QIF2_9FIRM|nr:SGNH/GDSL hydrolase family protein [Senimuribacter intestinalis]MCI9475032.1 hypothetical protein [Emergencia sp.]NBH61244.1 SGNH/GDSL hydrolase family protein [Anaerotruncus colihominis]NCE97800.1 SGNH/GDSL hydrolase family protein [Emergencia sp. 1XD21-10]NCF01899.1 SGNH/GDSL hydrolase family protein [Anaerotruncus sp. 80]MCI9639815.1 hypothetical protein [Emergencia sp.]